MLLQEVCVITLANMEVSCPAASHWQTTLLWTGGSQKTAMMSGAMRAPVGVGGRNSVPSVGASVAQEELLLQGTAWLQPVSLTGVPVSLGNDVGSGAEWNSFASDGMATRVAGDALGAIHVVVVLEQLVADVVVP